MLAEPASRPWRRLLRFSMRGLIVLVLVIGGGMGWLARSARIQREAVAAIEKTGGRVIYDWRWSNQNFISEARPWVPRQLGEFMGIDYFGHVIAAFLG
jgi:hypothetical protein